MEQELTKILILKNSLELSGAENKDFTEVELSRLLKINSNEVIKLITDNELKDYFIISKKSKIKCPKCNSSVEIAPKLNYSFCQNCNQEIKQESLGLYNIGLNRGEMESFLIDYLINLSQKEGWEVRDSDNNFLVIRKDKQLIAFSVCLDESGLKEYFVLRGWAGEYNPESFILISLKFDKFISSYGSKDLKCLLNKLPEVFQEDFFKKTLNEVNKRIEVYNKEKKAEDSIKIEFKKFGDLIKLVDNLNELLNYLPARALQKGSESSSKKGNRFQKDIIALLNLSILRTKYVGGQNQPDGLGFIFREGHDEKSRWFPIEIKSFTPKDEAKPFYPLSEVARQIDKYSNSFSNQEIREVATLPAFIVIAYDFDINSSEEKKVIESFQNKHNTKIVLLPLKSLIKIILNFREKEIYYLPNDIIENFILKSNYITETQVDELFNALEKHNKNKYSEQMKIIREKTKKQGR
jgi:hypothetical protein